MVGGGAGVAHWHWIAQEGHIGSGGAIPWSYEMESSTGVCYVANQYDTDREGMGNITALRMPSGEQGYDPACVESKKLADCPLAMFVKLVAI